MPRGSARVNPADIGPALAITAGVALACLPLVTSLALPAVVAIWIVSTVLRSVAPVHQHCHAHLPIFRRGIVDGIYDVILMLAAGNTTAVWELQHVEGHHRGYLGGGFDPAANGRFGGGRVRFTVLGDALSVFDSWRIGDRAARIRLGGQVIVQLAVLATAFVLDARWAVAFVVAPWLLLRWFVFWISYAQHDSAPMTDVYDGSVTHFHWTNRVYLNVGHHTAHHEKPTLHWTRLPQRTRVIVERIPSSCLR